jgi:hypothetical protein
VPASRLLRPHAATVPYFPEQRYSAPTQRRPARNVDDNLSDRSAVNTDVIRVILIVVTAKWLSITASFSTNMINHS